MEGNGGTTEESGIEFTDKNPVFSETEGTGGTTEESGIEFTDKNPVFSEMEGTRGTTEESGIEFTDKNPVFSEMEGTGGTTEESGIEFTDKNPVFSEMKGTRGTTEESGIEFTDQNPDYSEMEGNGGTTEESGIESIETDDDDSICADDTIEYVDINEEITKHSLIAVLFESIYSHDDREFRRTIFKSADLSKPLFEAELPKMVGEIMKEIGNLEIQDATHVQNREERMGMEKMLVHSLQLINDNIFDRLLLVLSNFTFRREIFLVACKYGMHRAIDLMLKSEEMCGDLQLTLGEGIRHNVYYDQFSLEIIDLIIKADQEKVLDIDNVIDVIMEVDRYDSEQRTCRILDSYKKLPYHTVKRIFVCSWKYNWKSVLEYDIFESLFWTELKTGIQFCFARKDRYELGLLVLQLANGMRSCIDKGIKERTLELTENVFADYLFHAKDVGMIRRDYVHQSVLKAQNEIYFCDKRIQYAEECFFDRNQRLFSDFTASFNHTSLTVCRHCRERFHRLQLSSIWQFHQTQRHLIIRRFDPEIFQIAVREDNIVLVALLWELKKKGMLSSAQKALEISQFYRPFEMPTELVKNFSTVSDGMQKLLRNIYRKDFMMINRKDLESVYVDLSLKTTFDRSQRMQRKEVFLVVVFDRIRITNDKQTIFGGIPVLWRSLAEMTKVSKFRGESGLLQTVGIPHYLKERFFKQHRNLTIISMSTQREIGKEVLDVKYPSYCVVLYCWAKGYIPIGEREFTRKVGTFSIITDVREGFCSFAAGRKIFPGVGIYTKDKGEPKVGTLGGFVEKNGETFGITCAHVILKEQELMESIVNRKLVVQATETEHKIGTLYCHAFEYGRCQDVSVDAALIKLDGNVELDHAFPRMDQHSLSKAGFCDNKPPVYDDGTIISVDEERRNCVIKYGYTTGLTYGDLGVSKGTCARINEKINFPSFDSVTGENVKMETDDDNGNCGYMMYNQTEVYGARGETFFELGDSGSLVFKIMEGNRLRCIGLAFAYTSYGSALVTPIQNVLQSLNANCPSTSTQGSDLRMKKFKREVQNNQDEHNGNVLSTLLSQMQQMQSNIGDKMSRIEAKIDAKLSSVEDNIKSVEQKMDKKFVSVENDLKNIKVNIFPQKSSPDTHAKDSSDEDL